MAEDFKPHLFVKKTHTSQRFTGIPRPGGDKKIPNRDRNKHGNFISSKLSSIWKEYNDKLNTRESLELPFKRGEYITFLSSENNSLELKSLDSKRTSGADLLHVSFDKNTNRQKATVYIPEEKRDKFLKTVDNYINKNSVYQGKDSGRPRHQSLVNKIENLKRSSVEDFWNSPMKFIPKKDTIWCELWLSGGIELYEEVKLDFVELCELFNIEIGKGFIQFPERTIVVIKASFDQLNELLQSFDHIAEMRKPQELNSFWLSQITVDREEWLQNATNNTVYNKTNNFISILDTGVNNGHLLIQPILDNQNKLTVNENWGTNDVGGHGTRMAGVAVYGNLNETLEDPNGNIINHQLESIKIIPPEGWNEDGRLPIITQDAISIATINNPDIKRIYCFANTGRFSFDFGKPSSWSATIDNLIFGEDETRKKIFVISAGNVRNEDGYENYPDNNLNLQIESPAQSWNAISVGAYTEKTLPNVRTLANNKELSPFSRTSNAWENSWPIKPDVVFEGGNLIRLDNGELDFNYDLEVLTTSSNAMVNQLTTINATSAATAFGSNFIAKLRDVYPEAWEETLRALVIHSASWTEAMKQQFNFDKSQSSIIQMLRTFGYGVPNLDRAISCKSNYLTYISEEIIQPYIKEGARDPRTNKVHFYEFPWPEDTLQALGNLDVTMRVTLSYFIEPNPGEKGYSTNYSYQSAALKFALMPPNDTPENFMLRINNAAREKLKEKLGLEKKDKLPEGEIEDINNVKWDLGADNVFKGSIHSNYWKTSAANIAACKYIAVYPIASGWWKNLKKQKKFNEELRYSLIVSIETPENTQDIYTEIANKVKVENLIKI